MATYKSNEVPEAAEGIYRVPEVNFSEFQTRIEKLRRRAEKLGVEPVSFETVGDFFVSGEKRKVNDFTGEVTVTKTLTKYFEVRVSGAAPKLAGWTFVATIQHEEAGNVLRTVQTWKGTLPEEYRTALSENCDHCRTRRVRRDTYVLLSDAGEFKQVGRTCLRDFLGHVSPEHVAEWAEILSDLGAYLTGGFSGLGGVIYANLTEVLSYAAVIGRLHGFYSKASAARLSTDERSVTPTSTLVANCFFPMTPKVGDEAMEEIEANITDADRTFAAEAREWAAGIETPASDYEWNIRTIARSEAIQYRSFGLAVSIVIVHKRNLEKAANEAAERKARKASEHFGIVGRRENFGLSVISTRTYESQYGTGTLVMFRDIDGNFAKWFASGNVTSDFGDGKAFVVKATVKGHEEYNGRKETVLTRVKVVSEADFNALPAGK